MNASNSSHFLLQRGLEIGKRIGNTPLLELRHSQSTEKPELKLFAKTEWSNPGGSVKDRPAHNMVMEGLLSGAFTSEKILLDATSGNTGIAYALLGAFMGFNVSLVIPENVSKERKQILKAYGADVQYTDPALSSDGAILEAKKRVKQDPESYFFPDQYNNDHNWKAHYKTTAPEIWEQTTGEVTHFLAGLGTSGTCMGTGKRLKELNSNIQIITVEPDSPFHGLEGLKRMDSAIVPGFYRPDFPDSKTEVRTEDAYKAIMHLAHSEGLLVGISSGAIYHAALELCKTLERGTVVCLFPDNADKYLSETFWSQSWA